VQSEGSANIIGFTGVSPAADKTSRLFDGGRAVADRIGGVHKFTP
jgi:hypothetical protein